MREVVINPITRLEGHGKITIFLNEEGDVDEAYLQVPELRGFEKFCEGRRAEDLPIITPRICGVCPVAHHMASAKALDAAFNVEPPEPAKKLRELMYCGYYLYDHTLHFYYLGGPDFVVGPDAPPEKRNVLGVIEKAGLEIGKEVIKHRAYGQKITEILGGKATHPVSACIPGGFSRPITEEERQEIERMVRSLLEFAKFSLKLFDDIVLKNPSYVSLVKSEAYTLKTYYMGLVDKNNKVNFYDGNVRVVDPAGREFIKFSPKEYLDVVEERVEPWTYVKLPYLKKVGWKGFVGGLESGVYRVGPLGRLNAADGMATPLAQEEYERMYATLGGKPVHYTLAYHWARLIELLYAAERALELVTDPEITSKNIRGKPDKPGEGVGIVEAARGTLIHHYQLDENALAKKVNLIVATTHNVPGICMSIRDAAKGLVKKGKVTDGVLNMIEMAFRAYDPCFACATHFAGGQMPLEVEIYDSEGRLIQKIKR
ncbi:MAG: Ni/Fe hydrogenase subunit alpha [Candidatus Bathyarchaeota archaeon]|nr:Ni/Fe hydrogenase subunit alpha [Candidatus Bathyarchaeota archaeon]MDW8040444.1 Ni/Fe hydrogenase subunit alpha [Nitrososphaerota archaeon]